MRTTMWKRGAFVTGLALGLAGLGSAIVLGANKPAHESARVDAGATVPAKATPETVRVTIQTVPARRASVRWGKKALGAIPVPKPLVVVRPRDSGPMDLLISAPGYLPVHTRAYTFSDSRLAVKLTPVAQKNTLFGYREELPPEGTDNPDGGASPLPPATPVVPTAAPSAAPRSP